MRVIFALITGLFFMTTAFAQTDRNETLTITTYYPSPTGVYVNLRVHRSVTFMPQNATDLTSSSGQAGEMAYSSTDEKFYYNNGSIWLPMGSDGTFPPQNASTLPPGQAGDLVYTDDDTWVYNNGDTWVSLVSGGGGGTVIYRSCTWGSDNITGNWSGWGNQCSPISNCCTPPGCPNAADWTDLGYNVEVNSVSCPATSSSIGCRWNTTNAAQHPVAVGRVVRICEKK